MLVGCLGSEYNLSQQDCADKNRELIIPPSSGVAKLANTGNRKKSKAYTRPIFKEPGSKILSIQPPSSSNIDAPNHRQPSEAFRPTAKTSQRRQDPPTSGTRSSIVKGLFQDANPVTKKHNSSHEELIQPSSKTSDRLARILGASADGQSATKKVPSYHAAGENLARDQSIGLEQRRFRAADYESISVLHRRDEESRIPSNVHYIGDDQTECGGSVATVSDLDYLASKSLRRKKSSHPLGNHQVSQLRREIKEMVVCLEEPPNTVGNQEAHGEKNLSKAVAAEKGDGQAQLILGFSGIICASPLWC